MKKQQIIILLVLLVLAAGSAVLWDSQKHEVTPPSTPTTTQSPTMIQLTDSTDYAITSGSYPSFPNASDDFNASIKADVNDAIDQHFEDSEENWKARAETSSPQDPVPAKPDPAARFELSVDTKIVRNDAHIISVLLTIEEYTGGAHGSQLLYTYNYDLDSKTPITIDTYTKKDTGFLAKLSAKARTMLRAQLAKAAQVSPSEIDTAMLNDGTEPVTSNFSLFTLPDDSHITFYFSQYQVAAYVFGSPSITLDLPLR